MLNLSLLIYTLRLHVFRIHYQGYCRVYFQICQYKTKGKVYEKFGMQTEEDREYG